MAEDTQMLLLPSCRDVFSRLQGSQPPYSGREIMNGRSSSGILEDNLSSLPVCNHYPKCEICEQCAKHNIYQKRVSPISCMVYT